MSCSFLHWFDTEIVETTDTYTHPHPHSPNRETNTHKSETRYILNYLHIETTRQQPLHCILYCNCSPRFFFRSLHEKKSYRIIKTWVMKIMAPKRSLINYNLEPSDDQIDHQVQLPYSDNWMWSKRHRSQEVVLSESTNRRGKKTF